MKGGAKPTMMDVARAAGVSQSTVSAVVNGNSRRIRVSHETEARVRAVMAELDFRPNLAARGLRLQRTKTIGFVSDFIASGPFAGRMVLGAQEEAWKDGHLLLVVNTDGQPNVADSGVQALIDHRVDGLIFASMHWGPVRVPPGVASVHSVLVNCWDGTDDDLATLQSEGEPAPTMPAVWPSEEWGGQLATEAVARAGHRDIAFLGGLRDAAALQRELGYRRAMAAFGLPVDERRITYTGSPEIDAGYRAAGQLVDQDDLPTAFVCYNDRVAVGVITALLTAGLKVPDDVSVVGYDDDEELAAYFPPGLTTVALPHYDLGQVAVQTLLQTMGADAPTTPRRVPGHVVTRGTVRPPRPTH